MNVCFQDLYTVPGTDTRLLYRGETDGGRWTNGILVSADGTEYAKVADGAAFFLEATKAVDLWGTDREIQQYLGRSREGLVRQNCRDRKTGGTGLFNYGEWVKPLVGDIGGLVLEVAIGPQGGVFPFLLSVDPTKAVLANDIGHWIVEDWNRVNRLDAIGTSLSFAQFDIRRCPIRSGSIDWIVSNQGISNANDVRDVLLELHRVLKAGGRMYVQETSFSENTLSRLTPQAKAEALSRWPHADPVSYLRTFGDVGLLTVSRDLLGRGQSWPVKGTWGDFGRDHGIVPLETNLYRMQLEKPRR